MGTKLRRHNFHTVRGRTNTPEPTSGRTPHGVFGACTWSGRNPPAEVTARTVHRTGHRQRLLRLPLYLEPAGWSLGARQPNRVPRRTCDNSALVLDVTGGASVSRSRRVYGSRPETLRGGQPTIGPPQTTRQPALCTRPLAP